MIGGVCLEEGEEDGDEIVELLGFLAVRFVL